MKKMLRTAKLALAMALIICIPSITITGWAADPNEVETLNDYGTYSSYLYEGSVVFQNFADYQTVIVRTSAFTKVNSIYHRIQVYRTRNGIQTLLHNQTHYKDNSTTFSTVLDFPAIDGDKFTVIADHYTNHNGLTETKHTC